MRRSNKLRLHSIFLYSARFVNVKSDIEPPRHKYGDEEITRRVNTNGARNAFAYCSRRIATAMQCRYEINACDVSRDQRRCAYHLTIDRFGMIKYMRRAFMKVTNRYRQKSKREQLLIVLH